MTEVYEFRHRHALAGTAERRPEHTPKPAPLAPGPTPDRWGRAARTEASAQRVWTGRLFGLLVLALLAIRREETPVS